MKSIENCKINLNGIGSVKFKKSTTSLGYYKIFYVLRRSTFFFNKTRRFFLARTKRLIKKKKISSKFWVNLGKVVFFFKKPLNARMGGGSGSFFSVRRHLTAGSYISYNFSLRLGFNNKALRHINFKLGNFVSKSVVFIRKVSRGLIRKPLKKFNKRVFTNWVGFRKKINTQINKFTMWRYLVKKHVNDNTNRRSFFRKNKYTKRIKRKIKIHLKNYKALTTSTRSYFKLVDFDENTPSS